MQPSDGGKTVIGPGVGHAGGDELLESGQGLRFRRPEGLPPFLQPVRVGPATGSSFLVAAERQMGIVQVALEELHGQAEHRLPKVIAEQDAVVADVLGLRGQERQVDGRSDADSGSAAIALVPLEVEGHRNHLESPLPDGRSGERVEDEPGRAVLEPARPAFVEVAGLGEDATGGPAV